MTSTNKIIDTILADYFSRDLAEVTPEATLHDLGADSLDTVEIALTLQEEFDVEITDDQLEQIKTVGDVHRIVGQLVEVAA